MLSISISATPPELGGGIEMISWPGSAAHGRAFFRLVGGEIRLRDQAAVGLHVLGDPIGDPALVERVRPIVGDRAQRLAEIREDEPIALGPLAAAGLPYAATDAGNGAIAPATSRLRLRASAGGEREALRGERRRRA